MATDTRVEAVSGKEGIADFQRCLVSKSCFSGVRFDFKFRQGGRKQDLKHAFSIEKMNDSAFLR